MRVSWKALAGAMVAAFSCHLLPIILVAWTTVGISVAAETGDERYGFGVREPTPEEWEIINRDLVPYAPPATRETLPSRHVNHLHLPPVGQQYGPTCYVYTVAYYYKTWQEARERGIEHPSTDDHIFSTDFLYPLTNNGKEQGGDPLMVMSTINRFGCVPQSLVTTPMGYRDFPPDDLWEQALPYRGSGTSTIDISTTEGVELLKQHLVTGDLATVSMQIFPATESYSGTGINSGVIYDANQTAIGSHAVTIIGYDDDITYDNGVEERSGAFLFVNSWGQNWGVSVPEVGTKGFGWFAYDYFTGGAAWPSAKIMYDRIGYQPEKLARISIDTESRKFLAFEIQATKPDGDTTSLPAFPYAGGKLSYDGEITVDITDFARDFSQYGLQ
jgi:hypothetical protein